MSETKRDNNVIQPVEGAQPEIGRWLWALEDNRAGTLSLLDGIDEAALDWQPAWALHSIGTLLYHIALVEFDWLYVEVMGYPADEPYPDAMMALFPYPMRSNNRLTHVEGISLGAAKARFEAVRQELLRVYKAMTLEDFRRVRVLPPYDVTPEWTLYHLIQHEAEHHSEISALRTGYLLT